MEQSGVIAVDVPDFDGDYWNGYNEDCDPNFQSGVIVDSGYLLDCLDESLNLEGCYSDPHDYILDI